MDVDLEDIGRVNLLACICFLFDLERLEHLSDVLASAYDLGVAHATIVIFTNTSNPVELSILDRLTSKFTSPRTTPSVSCHPGETAQSLPWMHKEFMESQHRKNDSAYTHYLYLEHDILFSFRNLKYFLRYRQELRVYGLLPGMVRYEYNTTYHDIFTPDQQERQNFDGKIRVLCCGVEFIALDVPYAEMFILDRELMDEYIPSRSFQRQSSSTVTNWGEPQRAAMGLTWERVPPGFRSRTVFPLRIGTDTPDAMCWVKHLPGNYTNNYSAGQSLNIGKTRMDEIFQDSDRRNRQLGYISCTSYTNGRAKPVSYHAELYPATSYDRPVPTILASAAFEAQLRAMYNEINQLHPAAARSILVSIDNVYILGPIIYVETGRDLTLLYETHRPIDRGFVTVPRPETILQAFKPRTEEPNTCTIFIGSAGSFNYGHWLVDDVPRLKSVYLLREAFPAQRIRILLTSFSALMNGVRKDCAERYLTDIDNYSIEFLDHTIPYKFDRIFYPSPTTWHPIVKSPPAITSLRDQVVGRSEHSVRLQDGSRVFLTRRPPERRTLLNHDEVSKFLTAQGFSVVDVNGLTFAQQVDIFKQARVVVGCMGAAMTNTVFAQRPATIVMLGPEGWVEPFYWDLASARGDAYHACYGEPNDRTVAAHSSSYTIDVARLRTLMSGLGLLR